MPTYEYETIPKNPKETPKRYEIRQSMSEEPLTVHPETGEKIQRIYSAFGIGGAAPSSSSSGGGSCCGNSSSCCN